MLRRQIILFMALALIGLLSFIYSSRALADLATFSPTSGRAIGAELVLNPTGKASLSSGDLDLKLVEAQAVVEQRLMQLNLRPHQVLIDRGQLLVDMPEPENMSYVRRVIGHQGHIEFIDGGPVSPPLGQRLQTRSGDSAYPLLFKGQAVTDILLPDAGTGQIFYELTLDEAATARLTKFVETRPDHYICIVVDQEVIACSEMYHWAEGQLDILPNLSSGSVINLSDLALFLKSGPLPMALYVQQR